MSLGLFTKIERDKKKEAIEEQHNVMITHLNIKQLCNDVKLAVAARNSRVHSPSYCTKLCPSEQVARIALLARLGFSVPPSRWQHRPTEAGPRSRENSSSSNPWRFHISLVTEIISIGRCGKCILRPHRGTVGTRPSVDFLATEAGTIPE
jgi:hypothetical protein